MSLPQNKDKRVVNIHLCEIVCQPCGANYPQNVRQNHNNWWAQAILPAVSTNSITFLYLFVTTLSFCPQNTNSMRTVYDEFGTFVGRRNVVAELQRLDCDVAMTASAIGNPIFVGLAMPSSACSLRNGRGAGYLVFTGTGSSDMDVSLHLSVFVRSSSHAPGDC